MKDIKNSRWYQIFISFQPLQLITVYRQKRHLRGAGAVVPQGKRKKEKKKRKKKKRKERKKKEGNYE